MKKNKKSLIVILVLLVGTMLLTGCDELLGNSTIRFEVTGEAATASLITYTNERGVIVTVGGVGGPVSLPWETTITIERNRSTTAELTANFPTPASVNTLRIFLDGREIASETNSHFHRRLFTRIN